MREGERGKRRAVHRDGRVRQVVGVRIGLQTSMSAVSASVAWLVKSLRTARVRAHIGHAFQRVQILPEHRPSDHLPPTPQARIHGAE